jgi:hypothetical protein
MDGLLGSIVLVGDGESAGRCIEYLDMVAPDHIRSSSQHSRTYICKMYQVLYLYPAHP